MAPTEHDVFLVERPAGYIVEGAGQATSFPFATCGGRWAAFHAAEDLIINVFHVEEEARPIWLYELGEGPVLHELAQRPEDVCPACGEEWRSMAQHAGCAAAVNAGVA